VAHRFFPNELSLTVHSLLLSEGPTQHTWVAARHVAPNVRHLTTVTSKPNPSPPFGGI
jgi:hypothetical protein